MVFHSPHIGPKNNSALMKINDFWQNDKGFPSNAKNRKCLQCCDGGSKKNRIIKSFARRPNAQRISRIENIQELMNSMQGFIDEQQQLEDGDPSLQFP